MTWVVLLRHSHLRFLRDFRSLLAILLLHNINLQVLRDLLEVQVELNLLSIRFLAVILRGSRQRLILGIIHHHLLQEPVVCLFQHQESVDLRGFRHNQW